MFVANADQSSIELKFNEQDKCVCKKDRSSVKQNNLISGLVIFDYLKGLKLAKIVVAMSRRW